MRKRWRSRILHIIGPVCTWVALVLLAVGIVVGWIAPRLNSALPFVQGLRAPATATVPDPSTFLGADLTTLGVIIAILIGYNVAAFQVAAQALSLALVRAILLTLLWFLLVWLFASSVTLVYLLAPPPVAGNLWQVGFYFGATVFLLIGYLAQLPKNLSGEYAAHWALDDLEDVPIGVWESTDGFAVLQASLGTAIGRSDVATVRSMVLPLGRFLSGRIDPVAENENHYSRARAYSLRNLFAACAPYRTTTTGAVLYNLGYAVASTFLQGAAIGQPFSHPNGGLSDSLVPSGFMIADRMLAIWAGLRHALCRSDAPDAPYLRRYWLEHGAWGQNDERLTVSVAAAVLQFHGSCWHELQNGLSGGVTGTAEQAANLLEGLYGYLPKYLATEAKHNLRGQQSRRVVGLSGALLDALQAEVRRTWPPQESVTLQQLEDAYVRYRAEITALQA